MKLKWKDTSNTTAYAYNSLPNFHHLLTCFKFWLVYAICDSGGCALEVVVNGGCPSVQLLAINLSPVNFTYKTPLIQESGVVNMYVEFEEAILNPDVSCDAVEVLVSFFYSNR
ncbi:uncharacterized protein LOC110940126 isoform X3 [Helianthus annuus]|uniref:uncharacterized protein LOC110940126 isoform X3 n=1 Tax=Helianthus annuus TaxID=4232 RepID=UPI00165335B6|nr:uncharacterized protein LOC110940126 isoform X3 [Helianthus annuus]